MPLTITGMSGVETDGMVQKLVEVESRPIRQLEIRKKNLNSRKEGLRGLGKLLEDIHGSAKDLYGLQASFYEKNAISSDKSVIDAKADKYAEKGLRKIKVSQIAAGHKISSDPMQENDILPTGTFTIEVNGEKATINFKGGKLKNLKEKIDEAASELVSTLYLNKSGDLYILSIHSNITGEKGEIKISGDRDLMKKAGLVDGEKSGKKSEVAVVFDRKYFEAYSGDIKVEAEDGKISVADDGRTVTVQGLLWREYALPIEVPVKDDTQFEFDVSYKDRPSDDNGTTPSELQVGPKERVNIKGIILEGYNVKRKRTDRGKTEKKVFDSLMGVGFVAVKDGKRVEKIYPIQKDAKGRQTIDIGKDYKNSQVNRIILYSNQGAANFSNARISTPVGQKGQFALKNVISQPQDAKIIVDGIEVTRNRNEGLNDIIKGVTINLKRTSSNEVDLHIEHNTDASVEKVKKFVDAYNKYLDYHREITKAAKSEKPGEYIKNLSQSGLFVGDMTLTRLEGTLKTTVNSAYPNTAEKPIKVLSQIGVSTGAINAEWESIKSGRLILDDYVLRKAIAENPEGVAMFFGSDADGDNKTDNGMAYKVTYVLKPYVSTGKNIIASKIELEDTSIKLADENIKKKEDHLKKYEEKLKRKFAQMDRALSESNSKKQWMRYQIDGVSGDNVNAKKQK